MNILPLKNNIMFKFLDDTGGDKNKFAERQKGLIVIPKLDSAQKLPRWGVAVAVGPDSEVAVGDYMLIEALMWTYGITFEDEKYWKTDDTKVMLVTNDYEATLGTEFK